jgi:hypothetical protein
MTSASCCHSSLSYLLLSYLTWCMLSTSRPLFICKFHRQPVYDERQLLPLQPILSPLILSYLKYPDLFLSVNLVGYLSMTSASCCHSSRMLWRLSSARRRASCASRDATSRRTSAPPSLSGPAPSRLKIIRSWMCLFQYSRANIFYIFFILQYYLRYTETQVYRIL